jgi:hypothetical protein
MPIMIREAVIEISLHMGPEKESISKKGSRKIPMILLVRKMIKIYMSVALEILNIQPENFRKRNLHR